MPETLPDLIGSKEAAEILGVNRSTFTRMVGRGLIAPAHSIPGDTGAMLFLRGDIDTLKAARLGAAS